MTGKPQGTSRPSPHGLPYGLVDRPLLLIKRLQMRLTSAIDQALRPLDIDVREFTVLTLLATEGAQTQRAISDRLQVDRTTITALTDELEDKGLAERQRAPRDRRAYLVRLTPAGNQLLDKALPAVKSAEGGTFAALSGEQSTLLHDLLRRACAD